MSWNRDGQPRRWTRRPGSMPDSSRTRDRREARIVRASDASPTVAAACLADACINKCAGTLGGGDDDGDDEEPRAALCLPPLLASHRPRERRERIHRAAVTDAVSPTDFSRDDRGEEGTLWRISFRESRCRGPYRVRAHAGSRDQRRRITARRISLPKQNTDGRAARRRQRRMAQRAASAAERSEHRLGVRATAARVRRPRLAAGTAVARAGAATTNFQRCSQFN